jgi:hypothetical protein
MGLQRALPVLLFCLSAALDGEGCSLALRALAAGGPAPPAALADVERCPEAATFFGVAQLRAGNLSGGAAHLEAVVRRAPPLASWVASAYLGASMELAARELFAAGRGSAHLRALRAAAAHFSRAEEGRAAWAAAGKPHPALQAVAQPLPLLYRSWGQALLWAGEERAARAVFQRGVDAGFGWVTPWARPTVPLAPLGGAPRPFFDAATAPALAPTLRALEAAAPALAAEFGGLLRRRKGARAALAKEAAGLHEPGAAGGFWGVHVLAVDGALAAAGCAQTPAACALLAALPLPNATRSGQAKFSVLRAGTRIRPHAGPTNARLRVHLCLRELAAGPAAATLRVGGVARHWRAGEAFAFDESFEHEVETAAAVAVAPGGEGAGGAGAGPSEDLEDLRIVLIVDVPNVFLDRAEDFRAHAVSDAAWARHGDALRAAFAAAREGRAANQ